MRRDKDKINKKLYSHLFLSYLPLSAVATAVGGGACMSRKRGGRMRVRATTAGEHRKSRNVPPAGCLTGRHRLPRTSSRTGGRPAHRRLRLAVAGDGPWCNGARRDAPEGVSRGRWGVLTVQGWSGIVSAMGYAANLVRADDLGENRGGGLLARLGRCCDLCHGRCLSKLRKNENK